MAAQPTYIGTEQILSAFEEKADTPFFSLWIGKECAEYNTENDFDKAVDKLERQLKAFANADITHTFCIAIHSATKKGGWKHADTKENAKLMYCAIRKVETPYGYNSANAINMQILEKLNAFESRINAIEAAETEPETDEIGQTSDDTIQKINGIVNGLSSIIASPVVSILLQNIFGKTLQPVKTLAGDQDDINEVLTVLFNKGVTVQHLKKLSEYPTDKIQMLLQML